MKACFMGLGYIGLPTAIIAAHQGDIDVLGVDINPDTVQMTNAGQLHIIEPGLEDLLREVVSSGRLVAAGAPAPADVFLIVVPTPFKGDHTPDTSYVEQATRQVIPYLRPGNLFIIESTSPIGTTEAMARIIFDERPDLRGQISVAYCPERVLPGNVIYELVHNDRVIGGIDEASTVAACDFYSRFVKGVLHHTDARTAEMCKLTENSSRDVQIAFANELSLICDKAGVNVWNLIDLANRHPRVNILQPGCGVGGHCIAVDPYFLSSAFPDEARIIAQARRTNNYKSEWCAQKIINTILRYRIAHHRAPVVALMGLAFKPDIDDLRESPAVKIVREVCAANTGATLLVSEPNVKRWEHGKLTPYDEAFRQADIVVMLTAHSPFRSLQCDSHRQILDFCGVFK